MTEDSDFPTVEEVTAVFRRLDQMCNTTKDREEVADMIWLLKRALSGPPMDVIPPRKREPCGAGMFYGQLRDDGRLCGRPKGHSSEGGQIAGGHSFDPLPSDPPTKKLVQKWVVAND